MEENKGPELVATVALRLRWHAALVTEPRPGAWVGLDVAAKEQRRGGDESNIAVTVGVTITLSVVNATDIAIDI